MNSIGALKLFDRECWIRRVHRALDCQNSMPPAVDVGGAAEELGCSTRTLYRWIKETPELQEWYRPAPAWHRTKTMVTKESK